MNGNQIYIDPILLAKEVKFKMSSSSGNGGQNVNRVSTKAALYFPFKESLLLNESQKIIIAEKLKNRISNEGFLLIVNQESRSANQNKKAAVQTLLNLLQQALRPKKVRKKFKIPKIIKEKRLASKKHKSEKKEMRKKIIY